MLRFLIRRFLALIALLIATSIVTFLLFFAGPSDVAANSCGKGCTPERIQQARVALGLDKPLVVQYLEYMKGLVAGREMGPPNGRYWCSWPCFGTSFQNNRPVWDIIKTALPFTLSIAIGAAAIFLIFRPEDPDWAPGYRIAPGCIHFRPEYAAPLVAERSTRTTGPQPLEPAFHRKR